MRLMEYSTASYPCPSRFRALVITLYSARSRFSAFWSLLMLMTLSAAPESRKIFEKTAKRQFYTKRHFPIFKFDLPL